MSAPSNPDRGSGPASDSDTSTSSETSRLGDLARLFGIPVDAYMNTNMPTEERASKSSADEAVSRPMDGDDSEEAGQTGQTGHIRCYSCDSEYAYLGEEAHPGACQACGSRAVSPSGAITFESASPVEAIGEATARQFTRVLAHDESQREYQYLLDCDLDAVSNTDDGQGQGQERELLRVELARLIINYEDALDPETAIETPLVPVADLEAHLSRRLDRDVAVVARGSDSESSDSDSEPGK